MAARWSADCRRSRRCAGTVRPRRSSGLRPGSRSCRYRPHGNDLGSHVADTRGGPQQAHYPTKRVGTTAPFHVRYRRERHWRADRCKCGRSRTRSRVGHVMRLHPESGSTRWRNRAQKNLTTAITLTPTHITPQWSQFTPFGSEYRSHRGHGKIFWAAKPATTSRLLVRQHRGMPIHAAASPTLPGRAARSADSSDDERRSGDRSRHQCPVKEDHRCAHRELALCGRRPDLLAALSDLHATTPDRSAKSRYPICRSAHWRIDESDPGRGLGKSADRDAFTRYFAAGDGNQRAM